MQNSKENKILDVIISSKLSVLIERLNTLGIQKEDLVSIYETDKSGELKYTAIFYY